MRKITIRNHSTVLFDFNRAIEALKKQVPTKPKEYEDKYYACKCGNCLLMKWEKYPTIKVSKNQDCRIA